MNPIKSFLHVALWAVFGLVLLTGCDSVEVNNEPPNLPPGPAIEIPVPDFVARASFSMEIPVAGKALFRLKAYNGKIQIKCLAEATSVTITGERRVGADSMEEAKAYLESLEVRAEDRDDEVFVHTIHPEGKNEGRQYTVDYTITIPQNLAVAIDHVNGPVSVDDLHASASVTLINGDIEGAMTLPLNGGIDLSTVNGKIDLVLPVSTSAKFTATTGFGTVSVSNLNVKGGSSAPRSLNGTLGAGEGTIALHTSIGDISVTGK